MSVIREAQLHDLPGMYRVCLQTGDTGRDATPLYRNPDLLGHVYVGPYVVGQPHLAFTLVDPEGVCGYVVAAENTRAFEDWQETDWWPSLRAQYPVTTGATPDDLIVRQIHHRAREPDGVVSEYPAHLHIDLLERAQGQGSGRALMARLLAALRERESPGVHLYVSRRNRHAIGFYRHVGFDELSETSQSLLMAMKLRAS